MIFLSVTDSDIHIEKEKYATVFGYWIKKYINDNPNCVKSIEDLLKEFNKEYLQC